jgi:hypothetical protein
MPASGLREPQLADLAFHFIHLAGGMRSIAKLIFDEYNTAAPGSVMRLRYLEMILQAVRFANQHNPQSTDRGLISDEDLDRRIKEQLGEMISKIEARNGNKPL